MPDAVMVTSSFLPGRGGIESYLAELCDFVKPRLAVLAAAHRDGEPLPTDLGYPAHGHEGSMLIPSRSVLRAIESVARAHQTDGILFGTPWPLGLLGPALARRGLRYAVIVHGAELLVPAAVPGIRGRLARALAGAELLLPVSDYTGARLRALLEGRSLPVPPLETLRARVDHHRFHPGAETGPARRRLGLDDDEQVILCFGRLVKRKGIDRLIAALPLINTRVRGAAVLIAGTGPAEDRLRRLAERTPGKIVFAGRVSAEEAPAVYALADVFALPVTDRYFGLEIEGLGVVLLEAAAAGVPCVTGRSGGTPEAVLDGRTGFVIDGHDTQALADRISRLLEDPTEARAMGAAGRAHVMSEFSAGSPPAPLLAWLDKELR